MSNASINQVTLGISGPSGSGKTSLIEQLIPVLTAFGLSVSTVKHVHHNLELDKPGKDSFRHREAGALEVMVSLPSGWALFHPGRSGNREPIAALTRQMSPVDLVLVEGFRSMKIQKIEVFDSTLGSQLTQPEDPTVIAVVADTKLPGLTVPTFLRDDIKAIAAFVRERLAHR